MSLSKLTASLDIIAALDDEPNDVGGLSAAELKAKFDEAGNIIKTYLNDTLTEQITAANVPFAPAEGISGATVQAAVENVHSQLVDMAQGVIPDGSVSSAKIADGAVTSAKIASGAVTEAKLGSAAVTSAKIASGAVTEAKLASAVKAQIAAAGSAVKLHESTLEAYSHDVTITLSADISGFSRLTVLVWSAPHTGIGSVSFSFHAGEDAAAQQLGENTAGGSGTFGACMSEAVFAANSDSACEVHAVSFNPSAVGYHYYTGAAKAQGTKLFFTCVGGERFETGTKFTVFGLK